MVDFMGCCWHLFIEYRYCISLLHTFVGYVYCIFLLRIFNAYLYFISLLSCCFLLLFGSWVDFWSFWGCLGSIFGRLGGSGGSFWGLGGSSAALGGVLEGLGTVLGSHGLLGVVFASPRPAAPRHLENFGSPKGAQDGAKMRPKRDQNRRQKRR